MRVRFFTAVAVLALVLTGCKGTDDGASLVPTGGQQGNPGKADPPPAKGEKPAGGGLDNIVEGSKKAGTAKVAGSVEAEVDGNKMTMMSMDGAVDFTNKRSKAVTKMMAPGGDSGGAGGMTVIVDGVTAYMRYDILGQAAHWLKFDLTTMLGKAGANDAGSYISLMAGITESSKVGPDTVRGVQATHYEATVDPEKVLQKYPEMREFLDSMLKAAETMVPGSTKDAGDARQPSKYDLWVDDGGRICRIAQKFSTKSDDGKVVTGVSMTEYYDYGAAVDITPPPPGEIQGG